MNNMLFSQFDVYKCLLLAFFVSLAPTSAAFANSEAGQAIQRSVSVSGSAQVKVVPDTVIVSLSASNRGANLLRTQEANDKSVAKYLSYLRKKLKVKAKNLQTDHHSVSPRFEYCSGAEERTGTCDPMRIKFYTVEKNIQIRLEDPKKYETVIRKAFEMGVSRIHGVQFISTKLRKHRDKARKLATIAAKEKAAAAATTLGMKLKKPISIDVTDSPWRSFRGGMNNTIQNQMSAQSSGGDTSGIALGQISISADVRVRFEIE